MTMIDYWNSVDIHGMVVIALGGLALVTLLVGLFL